MQKQEMISLLTYFEGKLMLQKNDLVEIACMDPKAKSDFFFFLDTYLSIKASEINGKYIERCRNFWTSEFNPKSKDEILTHKFYKKELIVDSTIYEQIKRYIFDLAYTKFSRRIDPYNKDSRIYDLFGMTVVLEQDEKVYSYLQKSDTNLERYYYSMSYDPIDKEDYEKRYSLLKK